MNELISSAVALLRNSPTLGDEAIYQLLVAEGFEHQIAARLVEFLPIAYGRLILANSGIRFSDTFERILPDGRISSKSLSSEPLWESAVAFARTEADHGVSGKDLLAVAGRSAELHAANQLLQEGAKLEDLAFTP